jgi:hypothetical protein
MTGSSSDDWILLADQLQPLLITIHHSAIAIPHTLQSLHVVIHTVYFQQSSLHLNLHITSSIYDTWYHYTDLSLWLTHALTACITITSSHWIVTLYYWLNSAWSVDWYSLRVDSLKSPLLTSVLLSCHVPRHWSADHCPAENGLLLLRNHWAA